MEVKIYNSLTNRKEVFEPIRENEVTLLRMRSDGLLLRPYRKYASGRNVRYSEEAFHSSRL